MFWADEIAEDIIKTYPDKQKFIVRDEKTLSGRVHIGSLRGVVVHGLVAQALNERGKDCEYLFEFNDFDPMDGLPVYIDQEKYLPHMGEPLCNVPSPEPGFANFAEYFGDEFLKVINRIGFYPKIIRSSELYKSGQYNQWIQKVLLHPDKIRKIYKEVSGSQKPDDWYPLQVVCEKCGKVGTTMVTGINGDNVTYKCMPNLVKWAVGCGYEGQVNPLDGRAKLPWKIEWPVKWAGLGVTVEGSGKDHNAAGGSHDIASRVCKEVLEMPVPYNIPYEFFLIGGKKMSSSKGMGASSKAVSDLLPPEILRFLMVKTIPKRIIEFNPEGSTIPVLFDHYDEASKEYFSKVDENSNFSQMFHFSQINNQVEPVEHFSPRFNRVAFFVQMPHIDIPEELAKLKEAPLSKEDLIEADQRIFYAKKWLQDYAPEDFVFKVQVNTPNVILNIDQKQFLSDVADVMEDSHLIGADLHAKIHEIRKASPLEPREGFEAIYLALLGKSSGPQAGWFLEALDKEFVIKRFREIVEKEFIAEESKTPVVAGLQNDKVVIGEIISIDNHPDAERLHICQINVGSETLQIVCGATNITVGDIVPVSLIGAQVYDDKHEAMEIKIAKLRGIESHGMLCSARELGLGDDHSGIYLLDKNLISEVGKPVKEFVK